MTYAKPLGDELLTDKLTNIGHLVQKLDNAAHKDQEQQTTEDLINAVNQIDLDDLEDNLADVQDIKKILMNLQCLLMNDAAANGLDEQSKTLIKEANMEDTPKKPATYDNASSSSNNTSRVDYEEDGGFHQMNGITILIIINYRQKVDFRKILLKNSKFTVR